MAQLHMHNPQHARVRFNKPEMVMVEKQTNWFVTIVVLGITCPMFVAFVIWMYKLIQFGLANGI